jgi:GMP synthase (glutamine-hydrolysing)
VKTNVMLGLSGGVDSSVTALLLHRAIGNRLTCVFVDNGLLRLNEGEQVMAMFGENFGLNMIRGGRRSLPECAGRRQRPRSQAQDHRPRIR